MIQTWAFKNEPDPAFEQSLSFHHLARMSSGIPKVDQNRLFSEQKLTIIKMTKVDQNNTHFVF